MAAALRGGVSPRGAADVATTAIANRSGIVFKLGMSAEGIRVRFTLTREVYARRRPDPQPFGNNPEMLRPA